MMQYRAVRSINEECWHIECFDTEHQVAYKHWNTDVEPNHVQKFIDKPAAEYFIKAYLIKKSDKGEVGEWILGSF
jgi:hypothetical protein